MSAIKFGFSKKIQSSKLVDSKLRDESTKDEEEEKDFVKLVVGDEIQGTLKKEKAKEWVIPLIKQNVWRADGKVESTTKSKETNVKTNETFPSQPSAAAPEPLTAEQRLERLAMSELLAQAGGSVDKEDSIYEVPLLLQNRIPTGYEQDDNMDVSLRPEQSTLDDYETFPVEQFGMAMLRGMGWKKTEGIGRTNKGVIELKEPTLRPKGLGLGAERPQAGSADAVPSSAKNQGQQKLILKIGAFVLINKGTNKGSYGQVESFDEDNNRVILKLAINGIMVAVSKFYIDLVSSEEYNEKSKILNLDKYEKYKNSQEQNGGHHKGQSSDEHHHRHKRDEQKEDRLEDTFAARNSSKKRERFDEKEYRVHEDTSRSRDREEGRSHHEEHRSHRPKKDKKSSKKHKRDSSSPRSGKKSHKRKHRD